VGGTVQFERRLIEKVGRGERVVGMLVCCIARPIVNDSDDEGDVAVRGREIFPYICVFGLVLGRALRRG